MKPHNEFLIGIERFQDIAVLLEQLRLPESRLCGRWSEGILVRNQLVFLDRGGSLARVIGGFGLLIHRLALGGGGVVVPGEELKVVFVAT